MKARDFGFLLAGLFLGVVICAFVLPPRPAPPAPPVATQPPPETPAPAAAPAEASTTSVPEPAYHPGGHVYLAGDVHTQGAVEIRPNETLTVSQAIALAGGVADTGDRSQVKLLRLKADGTSEIIPADLKISDSGYAVDPTVKPGDVINVPDKQLNR